MKEDIIELVGPSAVGKTTVKRNILKKKSDLIDSNAIVLQSNSRFVKIFHGIYALIKVILKEPVLFLGTFRFICTYEHKFPRKLIHRIATFVLVLERLINTKKYNKPAIFCEGYIKQLKAIYEFKECKVNKRKLQKLIDMYNAKYPTKFIYLKSTPEVRLQRMKKRRRKTDIPVLESKKPLEKLRKQREKGMQFKEEFLKDSVEINTNQSVDEITNELKDKLK